MHKTKVAIVGLGTVGSGVARLLLDHGDRNRAACRQNALVTKGCRPRSPQGRVNANLPPGILTDRLEDVLEDEDIEVVALLMGGPRTSPHSDAQVAGRW